jgi:hypothetical protein
MLINSGGTAGTVLENWIMAEFVPSGQSSRNLRSNGHNDLGIITFAAGEMKDLTYRLPTEALWYTVMTTIEPSISINEERAGTLYFAGAILYADDAGNRRRSVFRRRWDLQRKAFVRVDDPDQEYAD